MTTYNLPVLATVILLFPMLYFAFASLTFFLRPFDDPTVTWLLRGLFNAYFLAVAIVGCLGVALFALAGQAPVAIAIGCSAICALAARRWFLRRMDGLLRARDAGDAGATRGLRRLHLAGIFYNAVQVGAVIASIPFVLVPAA